jgi:hypothetical protein
MRQALRAWILALVASAGSALAADGLTLIRPTDGETIHDNTGRVAVVVSGGRDAAGFQAYIDGAPAGGIHPAPAFHLEGIERGEHQLSVDAVDRHGRSVAATETITFYMWQASRLFPNRK